MERKSCVLFSAIKSKLKMLPDAPVLTHVYIILVSWYQKREKLNITINYL